MEHYKIGFHTGPGGNRTGIGEHWRTLDNEGIPASLISVDDYGPCFELDNIAKSSGVPHVIVYRVNDKIPGFNPDVPRYDLDPILAAELWWNTMYLYLPPEFVSGDARKRVWIMAGNEVDKNRASWLGYWARAVAVLANRDGFKIIAFGWSSGEPEYDDWTEPGMAAYLEYCSENPDKAAIGVHEYSYTLDLNDGWGYMIGRFAFIEDACADLGLYTLPKVFVTEFGWTYQSVPEPYEAIRQMWRAVDLYAAAPNVQGAMIWYLGPGYGDIANQAQRLIAPVTSAAVEYGYEPPVEPPPSEGEMIDLAEYFCPESEAAYGPIYMLENNWGQGPERTHLVVSPTGSTRHFYVSKNSQWERRWVGDDWIFLQADTSPGNDEFYTVTGEPWLPRFMKAGQVHQRSESVNVYDINTCAWKASSGMTSDIKMIGIDSVLSGELGFSVVHLVWLINGIVEEEYFYGKHVGLVGWKKHNGFESWLDHFVPSNEQPNKIEWRCTLLDEMEPANIPVPPPTETLEQRAWDKTVEMQVSGVGGLRLNSKAAIQIAVDKENDLHDYKLQLVTDETIIDGVTFQAAESLNGSVARRVYRWENGVPIRFFEDPNSF